MLRERLVHRLQSVGRTRHDINLANEFGSLLETLETTSRGFRAYENLWYGPRRGQ